MTTYVTQKNGAVAGVDYAHQVAPWDAPLAWGMHAFIEYNGYVINDRKQADTIRITQITGLEDGDISDSREAVPGDEGEIPYDAWYRGRTITLTGEIRAGSLGVLKTLERDVKAAFAPLNESPLVFRWFDVYDSFDDANTLQNYTLQWGPPPTLAVTGGILHWSTTSSFIFSRTADNRLWSDNVTSIRSVVGSTTDNSSVSVVPALIDGNNYASVAFNPTVTATNLFPNPNFEHDAAGAFPAQILAFANANGSGGGLGSVTTSAAQTSWAASGTQSLRLTTINVSAGGDSAVRSLGYLPVTPSTVYNMLATVNRLAGTTAGVSCYLDIEWYDVNKNFISSVGGSSTTSTGVSTRTLTATSPSNAASALVYVLFISPANGTTIDVYIDQIYFGTGSTYIDGDMSGYSWLGTPGASASANNNIIISSVVDGTASVIGGSAVAGIVQGQPVWLRGRKDGDIITGELWLELPLDDTMPDFSATGTLAGSDADLLGDQVLAGAGFGAATNGSTWAFDDFRVSSISPCDVAFDARKLQPMSISDAQQSQTLFKRSFQVTMRASRPYARCATQSRSSIFVPSNLNPSNSQLGFTAPLTGPLRATQFPTLLSRQNNLLFVRNRGKAPDRPKIVVCGAISNFIIASITNDMWIQWSGTLADGDCLVFDCARRTLVDSLGADRKADLTYSDPRWMLIEPGMNELFLYGSNYSANTQAVAYTFGRWK